MMDEGGIYRLEIEFSSNGKWYLQVYRNDYWIDSNFFRLRWYGMLWARWVKYKEQRRQESKKKHSDTQKRSIPL